MSRRVQPAVVAVVLSPSRASGRYGADYPGGVIEVTMRPLD